MRTIAEKRDYAKRLVDYHSTKNAEQKTDQVYYDDDFEVGITKPFHIVRTGKASKIVDGICERIETAEPRAFREPRKKTEKELASAMKVSRLLNHWLKMLIPTMDEALKNAVLRGEGIFQIEYDENYEDGLLNAMPLIVTAPDPLIVFCDPYGALRPSVAVKSFNTNVSSLLVNYPNWSNPKGVKIDSTRGVNYLSFWDDKEKYFEADKEALLTEATVNPYGFTPFVHLYSGFGKL